VKFWQNGANFLALNRQSTGLPIRIHHSFFDDNGRSGYVLQSKTCKNNRFHPRALWKVSFLTDLFAMDDDNFMDVHIIDSQRPGYNHPQHQERDDSAELQFSGNLLDEQGNVSFFRFANFHRLVKPLSPNIRKNVMNTGINMDTSLEEDEKFERFVLESECLVPVFQSRPGTRNIVLRNPVTNAGLHKALVHLSVD
jgi:hypothetical protein